MAGRGAGPLAQTLVGLGVLALGLVVVVGAVDIPAGTGYAGVGPAFLPWLVGLGLLVCGACVLWEARTGGGYRHLEPPSGAARGYWSGFAWVSAALLVNAALITTVGFILGCALCFMLAVRGLRNADRQAGAGGPRRGTLDQTLRDGAIGLAIAAPVYWMFTKLLGLHLPGLTATGWL